MRFKIWSGFLWLRIGTGDRVLVNTNEHPLPVICEGFLDKLSG
jgi:hypothetical protein